MAKKEKSEFGKGLVICLVKFAEHFENSYALRIANVHWKYFGKGKGTDITKYGRDLQDNIAMFEKIELKVHKDPKKALSSMIEMWANGASDHLYEIEIPKGTEKTQGAKKVKKLQHLALEMGHGFIGKTYTYEDFKKLQALTREIAMCLDNALGLKPDLGEW